MRNTADVMLTGEAALTPEDQERLDEMLAGLPRVGEEDLFVLRLLVRLQFVKQLFEEFLARAQPDELDLDVLAHAQPGQANHVLGQVDDPHGVAHVEDQAAGAGTPPGRTHQPRARRRSRISQACSSPSRWRLR